MSSGNQTSLRMLGAIDVDNVYGLDFAQDGSPLLADVDGISKHSVEGIQANIDQNSKLPGIDGVIYDLAVHGSTIAAIGGLPGSLYMSTDSGRTWYSIKLDHLPCSVAVGSESAVVGFEDNTLAKFKYRKSQIIWRIKLNSKPHHVALSHKGRILVSLPDEHVMSMYDIGGRIIASVPTEASTKVLRPRGICFNSKGDIFVSNAQSKSVEMYDSNGIFVENILTCNGEPGYLAIFEDRLFAVGVTKGFSVRLCVFEFPC